MNQLPVHNPFNAPVYHVDTTSSTMEVSRELARQGEPHGTVIAADFQEAGRGRIARRLWESERGAGLLFTVLLRYPRIEEIPAALTLRAGLACCLAIEDFSPALSGRVKIKWPNDIVIPDAGKVVGILTEADGGNVHIGMGLNVAQRSFPEHLRAKATSIRLAAGGGKTGERFALLEKILAHLRGELALTHNGGWKERIEARLYKKGENVSFAPNAADSGQIVSGILAGIGPGGELLIATGEGPDGGLRPFLVGELLYKT